MLLFLIIVSSVVLVLDCTVLVFLVLMQLPKKEAGAGLAFGGAATDALFGAGSGNFLTKTTKWTAGIFFALSLALSLMQSYKAHQSGSDFLKAVSEHRSAQPDITAPPAATPPPATQPAASAATATNVLMTPQIETSAPATAPASTVPAATNK